MSAAALNLSWLLRLRWSLIALQALIMIGAQSLIGLHLPWLPLGLILALELGSNLIGHLWRARRPEASERALVILVALDLVCLTALLYCTGGPFNPFSFLYLVHIALIAVVLPPKISASLTLLAFGLYGLLFVHHWPLPHQNPHGHHDMSMHMRGMWLAFGLTAGFIGWFLHRITRAMAQQAEALALAQARNDRLAALATLSAGAAHELSTPLATISLVTKELILGLNQSGCGDLVEEAEVIRAEVARCRGVLEQMASDAGNPTGEPPQRLTLAALADLIVEGLPDRHPITRELDEGHLTTLPRALSRALRGLVKNAMDASPAGRPITLRVRQAAGSISVEVQDAGEGMPPEILARAEEPFFTTKPPGKGMGLGLFVTRTLLSQVGGDLTLRSTPGEGTLATVQLPVEITPTITLKGLP